jgi:hypothetical protein
LRSDFYGPENVVLQFQLTRFSIVCETQKTALRASNPQGHQRTQPEGQQRSLPTQRPQQLFLTAPTLNSFKSRLDAHWRDVSTHYNPFCLVNRIPAYRLQYYLAMHAANSTVAESCENAWSGLQYYLAMHAANSTVAESCENAWSGLQYYLAMHAANSTVAESCENAWSGLQYYLAMHAANSTVAESCENAWSGLPTRKDLRFKVKKCNEALEAKRLIKLFDRIEKKKRVLYRNRPTKRTTEVCRQIWGHCLHMLGLRFIGLKITSLLAKCAKVFVHKEMLHWQLL